ncbi:MAG: DUF819 family protein [Gemmatimonadales bacterium]|jgi:uncharacterized membrane protein|nr:MAG: DUF819 family protein [Gemmatimonadales bacterium]
MITSPVAITSVLALIVFGMTWLERYPRFRKLGAAAASILFTMALSNAGLIPGASPVYDFFTGYGVLAGTVLILLSVDLSSIKAAGSAMAVAFAIGAVGSAVGAAVMGFALYPGLGEETYKLSGQFAATYIGGGVNFAAVAQAFDTSGELFTAGVAADVIITAFWLVTCLAVPALWRGGGTSGGAVEGEAVRGSMAGGRAVDGEGAGEEATDPGADTAIAAAADTAPAEESDHPLVRALFSSGRPVGLTDLGGATALTVSSIWVSTLLSGVFPRIPAVFWLTTLALLLAQLPAVKRLSGTSVLGNYLILLFLACNGARSVVARIVEVGPEVFYFAVGTVAIHGTVIFGLGRLARLDLGTLAVASQANVGGSASAMAIATARGYDSRILPGVAVGILGVALGNYVGLGVGNLMRMLL